MPVEDPDGLKLTERLVTPAEMAQIIGIDAAEVSAWIEAGELDVRRGEHGEARVPIREHREIDGPLETGLVFYTGPRDPQLLAKARAKRRAVERDALIAAVVDVDIDALTAALAQRLAAVAPPEVRIDTTERGMVDVLDVRGGDAGIDVALTVVAREGDSRSPADRVVDASQRLLEAAQEEIAEVTTDPWPRRGFGTLPEPLAQRSQDGTTVRLLYGSATDPVLELDALSIADFLSS
ncbi:MAG: hypothetical protein ACLP50_28350 [Solirubrobacteraceae bacterium]